MLSNGLSVPITGNDVYHHDSEPICLGLVIEHTIVDMTNICCKFDHGVHIRENV